MSTLETFSKRNLHLVGGLPDRAWKKPWLLVHGIRTAFLVCILAVLIIYQVRIGNFLNTEIWLPVYGVLLANFLLNAIYLFNFDRFEGRAFWNVILFGADTVAISLLIHYTGVNQSLFLFLYLVDLILSGLVFEREGPWILTLWTSVCFSILLIFSPDVSGQSLYFSLAINNLAFAAVTFLSRRLREQLNVVGVQLEEARTDLIHLQKFNDLIVDNITNGILVVSRTGFIQFANSCASKILKRADLEQRKIDELLPNAEWSKWIQEFQDGDRYRREVIYKDGSEVDRVLEAVITAFDDEASRLKGWLLLLDDRTEVKALEDQLRQGEKLAAVGQLAAGIAHEIRNPLASISGSIQMMMTDTAPEPGETRKLMNIVSREIDRLNGLITEFLEYVRPEARANTLIDLNQVVGEVLEMIRFNGKLKQDVDQSIDLDAQSSILGHKDKLKQAVLNFIVNAYQAMDKTEKAKLEVITKDERDKVVLLIRDNGCGIKPENLNRIFEPFHTTKPQGTGLGLAVTHKILQAHEAKVFVESHPGEGTRFLIEFPAHRNFHEEDPLLKRQA